MLIHGHALRQHGFIILIISQQSITASKFAIKIHKFFLMSFVISYLARMTVSDMIVQMHWLHGAQDVSLMDEQLM